MKNIRKLLREQSKNVLPDEFVQENIRRELGLENAERSAAYAHGGTAAQGGRQKTIIALAAVLLAAALFLAVFLPIFLNRGTGKPTISNGKFSQIVTAEDFYMYSAVSVGAVLSSPQSGAQGRERGGRRGTCGKRGKPFRRARGRPSRQAGRDLPYLTAKEAAP